MNNQAFAIIATLALLVFFVATFSPVSANRWVVNVAPLSGLNRVHDNNGWSTTIFLYQTVDIYAQVSYVQSGGVPPSTFIWYVNGVAVKTDVIGSSTLTFVPTVIGEYNITVTVNGETNSELVTVIVITDYTLTPTLTPKPFPIPDHAEYTFALNETHDFEVTAGTNASIQWYLDGVLVKSEYAQHSTYTFVANSPGVYWLRYSVYGFNLCIPKKITVLTQTSTEPRSQSAIVVIQADGSVTGTNNILRNGDYYSFTGNITGSIFVHRSNMVLDGAGYTLQGWGGTGIDLTNNLTNYPSPNEIYNVTIKNLNILDFNFSINGHGSSYNTFYNDYIGSTTKDTQSNLILYWNRGGYNITHCTITGTVGIELSSGNIITENNLSRMLLQLVGNETIDRNYWNDYLTKYPNASEIGSSDVGDTPYVIDVYSNGHPTGVVQDNHPLMKPMIIPLIGSKPMPTATHHSGLPPQNPTVLLVVIVSIVIVAVAISLLFYSKHRKTANLKQ